LRLSLFVIGTGGRDGSDDLADLRRVLYRGQPAAVIGAGRAHGPHPAPVEFTLHGKPLGAELFGRSLAECVNDEIARTLRGAPITVSDSRAADPAAAVHTRDARTVDSLATIASTRIPLRCISSAI